jgi:hypothetical protein
MTSNSPSIGSATATTDATQQAPAVSEGPSGTVSSTQKIGSMNDLQKANPELYNMMMQGIAMTIVNDMRDHQRKLKALMAKARSDSKDH